ncbi:hypothetical protein ACLKA6_015932 [Drosophila palustris]
MSSARCLSHASMDRMGVEQKVQEEMEVERDKLVVASVATATVTATSSLFSCSPVTLSSSPRALQYLPGSVAGTGVEGGSQRVSASVLDSTRALRYPGQAQSVEPLLTSQPTPNQPRDRHLNVANTNTNTNCDLAAHKNNSLSAKRIVS